MVVRENIVTDMGVDMLVIPLSEVCRAGGNRGEDDCSILVVACLVSVPVYVFACSNGKDSIVMKIITPHILWRGPCLDLCWIGNHGGWWGCVKDNELGWRTR